MDQKDQKPEDQSTPPPQETEKEQKPAPPVTPAPEPPKEPAEGGDTQLSKDALNLGMLCHLLALCGFIIPLGNILAPLILWLVKKDENPYVDEQGKESLNFQISVAIYGIISAILMLAVIGFFLVVVVFIGWLVLTIIGAVKASKGEPWAYPLTIRMLK